MPKYMFQGSYTAEGLPGLIEKGGSARREAAKRAVEQLGGTLEAFYFCFGADDFVGIADMPSNVEMTTVALDVQVTGTIKSRITVLLTPEEVDEATKRSITFRAPGQ